MRNPQSFMTFRLDYRLTQCYKIGIYMQQTEGERNFIAPPLKTAPVFGGIAGIMTSEAGTDNDDGSNMPSMSSKAQESGKLQDMYRRNLAASWAAQAGELPADKCIEDIFAGGDGWADQHATQSNRAVGSSSAQGSTGEESEGDPRTARGHHRQHSSGSTLKQPGRNHVKTPSGSGPISGRTSIEQQVQSSHEAKRHSRLKGNEIDEISAREDLRSWEISAKG